MAPERTILHNLQEIGVAEKNPAVFNVKASTFVRDHMP